MYLLGIDIGGTKIAVSLATQDCKIIDTVKLPTPCDESFLSVFEQTCGAIERLLASNGIAQEQLAAIGISCPGPLDKRSGQIIYVATTGWRAVPIVDMFSAKFHIPVVLENDACCAALAEALKGAGMGHRVVVYFTVSTGVGGGIVIDGEIFQGEHGYAGELGHLSVEPDGADCGCGGVGCVQLYSSGTSIAGAAIKKSALDSSSVLHGKDRITAYDVEQAVRQGDPLACKIWDNAMEKLGIAVSLIYQSLNPGIFVFGGGVSKAWDIMESRILEAAQKRVYSDTFGKLKIRHAVLADTIGTTGAILLAARKSAQ